MYNRFAQIPLSAGHRSPLDPVIKTFTFDRLLLLLTVTVSGAAVMVYEFIAVRVLQRYFGGALEVWAAEIGVCLAGLAVGYALGGVLGDRFRSPRLLGAALLVAAGGGLLIVPLGEWAGELSLRTERAYFWQPLFASFACSVWSMIALGTVLPQAIRLTVTDVERVGHVAGLMSAQSTVGSIVGVLATGMVLLPNVGVIESLYGTAAVLALLSAPMLIRKGVPVAAALALLCLAPSASAQQIIFERYSAYHHILVEDAGDTRSLRFDNDYESTMSLSDPYAGGFEYADFFHVPMILDPTIGRVLFVGLGGGTGPKSFLQNYPNVRVDVAELDPMVVQVAKEYFALPEDRRLNVTVSDGRMYLQRSRAKYGAIMMDAYSHDRTGGYLPYHMATQEFFQTAWERLDNGGCLFYNVITDFGNGTVLRDLNATLESVFQMVYAFQAKTSRNTMLIAVKIDPSTLKPDGTRDGKGWPDGPWLAHPVSVSDFQQLATDLLEAGKLQLPQMPARLAQTIQVPRPGNLLTDNFAPVDARNR